MLLKNELDKNIKVLNKEKHALYVEQTQKLITNEDFESRICKIDIELRVLIQQKILEMQQSFKVNTKEVIQKQKVFNTQVKKVKRQTSKHLGHKVVDDSYSSLIIKALKISAVDTETKAIAVITKWKPGVHEENIRKQIRNTISAIKKHKQPRYKHFSWDQKLYKVNQSCQQIL